MSEARKHMDCREDACLVYKGQPCRVLQGICPDMKCLAIDTKGCKYPQWQMCIHPPVRSNTQFQNGDRVILVREPTWRGNQAKTGGAKVGESGTVQDYDDYDRSKMTAVHFDNERSSEVGWWVDNTCLEIEAPTDAEVEKAVESIRRAL